MIKQTIYLKKYGWFVTIFYVVTDIAVQSVLACLQEAGCSDEELEEYNERLDSIDYNEGFVYSNPTTKSSVMLISPTTSASEFQSTFDHEKGHLVMHIAEVEGIDVHGEEYQYLAGELGRRMFKVAKRFMCDTCRNDVMDLFFKRINE